LKAAGTSSLQDRQARWHKAQRGPHGNSLCTTIYQPSNSFNLNMRKHNVSLLVLAFVAQCCARELRQAAQGCPVELLNSVKDHMASASFKTAVASACAERELLLSRLGKPGNFAGAQHAY
jgi:hypothetical protein